MLCTGYFYSLVYYKIRHEAKAVYSQNTMMPTVYKNVKTK